MRRRRSDGDGGPDGNASSNGDTGPDCYPRAHATDRHDGPAAHGHNGTSTHCCPTGDSYATADGCATTDSCATGDGYATTDSYACAHRDAGPGTHEPDPRCEHEWEARRYSPAPGLLSPWDLGYL
jgi:hypothetical protein